MSRLRETLCLFLLAMVGGTAIDGQGAGSIAIGAPNSEEAAQYTVTVSVDFGRDIGQNHGTLFEMIDGHQNVVAGAGFLGAYNTFVRSNRVALNFFLRPHDSKPTFDRLPKPSRDSGAYLFDDHRQLFAVSASSGRDSALRRWDPDAKSWRVDTETTRLRTPVAGGALWVDGKRFVVDDRTVLELGPDDGGVGRHYFANGFLFLREVRPEKSARPSRLHAIAWEPEQKAAVRLVDGVSIDLPWNGEFVYAYGQLGKHTLVATNTGGVYRFDGKNWDVMIPPDRNVSFQIYSMLNYYDRLLMGQYPTGEIFEYDGKSIRRMEGWPPRMPGVSGSAREAQTLAIYGGELYVGVWPWAEGWRYQRGAKKWRFVGRMFTHPDVTDKFVHPYEQETSQRGAVANAWGQRVTSLVPMDSSLYVGTSAKSSTPWDPKFDFLDEERRSQYGSVVRLTQPGQLAVIVDLTRRPTTFRFTLGNGRMTVEQDGRALGEVALPEAMVRRMNVETITWGRGVYGPLSGKLDKTLVDRRLGGKLRATE